MKTIFNKKDIELIRKLYWEKNESLTEIAKKYNTHASTLFGFMKKNNINTRTVKEGADNRSLDLTNKKFNRLTCIEKLKEKHSHGGFVWKCICDCGNIVTAPTYRITNGDIPSCGCQKIEKRKNRIYKKTPSISFAKFISKFDSNKYLFTCENWVGVVKSLIKINCKEHGESEKLSVLLTKRSKSPCAKCSNRQRAKSKTKDYESCVKELKETHKNKYIYPKSNKKIYKNKRSKIKIICKEHGEFTKSAQKHLTGQGCWECKVKEMIDNKILVGGYNSNLFNEQPDIANSTGIIYYIKVGNMYKIGITRRNIKNRLNAIKSCSKLDVKFIDSQEMKLFQAYNLEQEILLEYKKYRIYNVRWTTEVFSKDVLKGKISNFNIIN